MAELSLTASRRTDVGRHSKALRRSGQVPAVLYGYKIEPQAIAADERHIVKIWKRAGKSHFIDLMIEGTSHRVLIREYQTNPRTARPVHVDFLALNMRQKMTADVPVMVVGESPAVSELKIGQLLQLLTHVKVECLPDDLPAQLTVDVTGLTEVDAGIHARELELPKGVELAMTDPDELVVKIAALRVQTAEDEAADAAAAEPAADDAAPDAAADAE